MRRTLALSLFAALSLSTAAPLTAQPAAQTAAQNAAQNPANEPITVELNAAEPVQNKCRVAFVIANKGATAIESLKLDLAIFNRDGVVQRRIVTEMAPLRRAKTIVKTFELENECGHSGHIGSILVNDVTACTPGDTAACLDRLTPSSKVSEIKFYK
jgi:hypothetical protein